MPTVSRAFTVAAPPDVVLSYLKDFARAQDWDPSIQRCTRLDDGPLRVGARWRAVSRIFGRDTELDYRLTQLTSSMLVFEGRNESTTVIDTIVVAPSTDGALISYRAQLKFHGPAVALSPALKVPFERIATRTRDQLTTILNSLPN